MIPLTEPEFTVASRWFHGTARLPTYSTSELLATKLRALYQRRKGRDLFDLWHANQIGVLQPLEVTEIFQHYMRTDNLTVSKDDFEENLHAKMAVPAFLSDTPPLLRPGIQFAPQEALAFVTDELISRLP